MPHRLLARQCKRCQGSVHFKGAPIKALAINLTAQGIGAVLSFVVLPLCARLLGMDAFGLLGIAATFQLIVFVLDGCNVMARLMVREADSDRVDAKLRAKSLLAAAERQYLRIFGFGAFICIALAFQLSPYLAANSTLSTTVIGQSLALIGIGTFIKLIASLYRGALVGLHAQVAANMIGLAANMVRFPLAYGCSLLVPDIRVFLGIQLVSFMLEAALLRRAFGARLGASGQTGPETGWRSIRDERRFILSTLGLAALTTLTSQIDKVMLASALSLREFGAASLAILLCGGLFVLVTPIHQIYLPRLASRSGIDSAAVRQTAAALMATLLCVSVPAALTVALCAPPITLLVAPGQADAAGLISDAFVLWGLGNCLAIAALGLYLLYFAAGQVARYSMLLAGYLALYLPTAWLALQTYGLHGAGAAWVGGNLLLLVILTVDLGWRKIIDRAVIRMLVGSTACIGAAWGLGGIIRPLLPASAPAAAAITVASFAAFLALTVLTFLPTLRRAGPP